MKPFQDMITQIRIRQSLIKKRFSLAEVLRIKDNGIYKARLVLRGFRREKEMITMIPSVLYRIVARREYF